MLNIGGCPPSGHKILEDLPEVDMGVFRGKKATVQKKEIKNLAKPALGKGSLRNKSSVFSLEAR